MTFKKIELIEPKYFSGEELAVVEIAPNMVKRTLITMSIEDEKIQNEIIDQISRVAVL